jgi:uncharacterized protein (TIGR02145 family)
MNKLARILTSGCLILFLIESCGIGGSNDELSIKKVTIGNQVWMAENLNVEEFRNGDAIPEAKSDEEWRKAGDTRQPAWCYFDNEPANGERYGKLYNWFAVNDSRGLAPEGWHIPTEAEWSELIKHLGGTNEACNKLKFISGWGKDYDGHSGNGTNESGFSCLPGGFRNPVGRFAVLGQCGYWWFSGELGSNKAGNINMSSYIYSLDYDGVSKKDGLSVRCLKD